MSISRRSRYIDAAAQQIKNKKTNLYNWTIYRVFPSSVKIKYIEYTWVFGDRIDYLASVYLGDPNLWWQIMDINPSIDDPMNISAGTKIRIPKK
jgi:nucleoid-associated protein YgaU